MGRLRFPNLGNPIFFDKSPGKKAASNLLDIQYPYEKQLGYSPGQQRSEDVEKRFERQKIT
jgi:hypothetical protein